MKKLIIIADTKNEIDDQFAICYALAHPEIELLGVISTQNVARNGPESLEIYHGEALELLGKASGNTPAFKGAKRPYGGRIQHSDGLDFMLEMAQRYQNDLAIVCIGPATDLLNLYLASSNLASKINLFWLGGYRFFKHLNCWDVNFTGDPSAAKKIVDLDLNLTIIPTFGTTHSLVVNTKKLKAKLVTKDTAIHNHLANLIDWNKKRIGEQKIYYLPLMDYWVFSDVGAVAASIDLGVLRIKENRLKIVTKMDNAKVLDDFQQKLFLLK